MATQYPAKKGAAFTVVFPILDADGDLVTAAAELDSEISKDGGTFADCTNEAAEIATSSGMYSLVLTTTEMNADIVAIIVKTTTADAKTTPIVIYTSAQTLDEIDANIDSILVDTGTTLENHLTDIKGSGFAKDTHSLPQCLTATGFSTHAAADIWTAATRALSTPADYKADVAALALEATLTDIKGTGFVKDTHSLPQCLTATGFSTHAAADIWAVGTRALTDKAGFALSEASRAAVADDVWDEVLTGAAHNDPTSAGRRLRQLSSITIHDGTAQAGALNSITLDAGASATDGIYAGNYVVIIAGTGIGQTRRICIYNGTSKVATVTRNWVTNPDNTSEFQIIGSVEERHVVCGIATAGAAGTITLEGGASATDDIYNDCLIHISTGTGAGQTRKITDYNGTGKVASVKPNWQVNPDATSTYHIISHGRSDVGEIEGSDASDVINAQCDQAIADYDPPTKGEMDTGFATLNDIAAADVWTAASRALSTPADYKADVSALALEATLGRALGLTQENFYIDNCTYSAGKLTVARLRIYNSAASVGTDADVAATYNVTVTWSGSDMTSYKVVKAA